MVKGCILSRLISISIFASCTIVLPSCSKKPPPKPPTPRPVKVVKLQAVNPSHKLQLTGVVEAWSEQDIAFEVPGRIDYIVEEGSLLKGRWVKAGKVINKGDVLATIDQETYIAARHVSEAEVKSAKVNLKSILPAELAAAKAGLDYAEFNLKQVTEAHSKNVATVVEVALSRAQRDISKAKVDQAEAAISAGKISLARAEAILTQSKLDLRYTTLMAPFDCQVSEVSVRVGGYVQAGQMVGHIVTMDPVKVNVVVSGQTNNTIAIGDQVDVYIPNRKESLQGRVYLKATVADPHTRTFKVTIITRNYLAAINPPKDQAVLKLPRINGIMSVMRVDLDNSKNFYVDEKQCMRKDGEGYFVWVIEGLSIKDRIDPSKFVGTVRKVRVVPGEHRVNLQGIYLLRELKDIGGLKSRQAIAAEPPDSLKDGDRVTWIPEDWILHPGAIVRVQFKRDERRPGFYVPMEAIMPTGESDGYVFVTNGADAKMKAQKLTVTLHETIGELQRIDNDQLADGMSVIVEGVHYLKDGEPITIVSKKVK
ncbi:MAG: HlyD family efflux transporter periplasmic adaptor subunit [Phycisphaerae bacterium]|nr:HlyD family efflux transporter periplasmic adaptor subunit [Phycisphaerae bacterium]